MDPHLDRHAKAERKMHEGFKSGPKCVGKGGRWCALMRTARGCGRRLSRSAPPCQLGLRRLGSSTTAAIRRRFWKYFVETLRKPNTHSGCLNDSLVQK